MFIMNQRLICNYSLSQKDEVLMGIGLRGYRLPWAYFTFLRTAISIKHNRLKVT